MGKNQLDYVGRYKNIEDDYLKIKNKSGITHSKKQKKQIAILHPFFGYGGSEAVCIKFIEALMDDFKIDLITNYGKVNMKRINRFYGTHFSSNDFRIIQTRGYLSGYPLGYTLKSHIVQKYFKKYKTRYDFAISTNNEMDFGKEGIQYIHFPSMHDAEIKNNIYRKFYYKICVGLSSYNKEGMKKNITLVNSYWTKEKVSEIYGIESKVVYPPIENVAKLPWDKKEDGFLCIGRIWPEKRIENIIEILREVRKKYPYIHLHIVGPVISKEYLKKIYSFTRNDKDWIYYDLNLSRSEIKELISRHKYGIHAMKEEHFGMVVAEMVKAGCIVFVPNGGGQLEIVGYEESIVYKNQEDAIGKVKQMIGTEIIQKKVLKKLHSLGNHFSEKMFAKDIKDTINSFVQS